MVCAHSIQIALLLILPRTFCLHVANIHNATYPFSPDTPFSPYAQFPQLVYSTFVTLADPQLGMSTAFGDATDLSNELTVFTGLVQKVSELRKQPKFVMLLGDMQNQWPKDDAEHPYRGPAERTAIQDALVPIQDKVYYTPGNHDINDVPSEDDINNYYTNWGKRAETTHWKTGLNSGTLMITINSQIYQTAAQQGQDASDELKEQREKLKGEQRIFLETALGEIDAATKQVIIMTHIPPFMSDVNEKAGWANWGEEDRMEVMNAIFDAFTIKGVKPRLVWICGHFHTQVVNKGVKVDLGGRNHLTMDIIVTNSAGTSMWWGNANCNGELTPQQAAEVATMPVGGPNGAFSKWIFGDSFLGQEKCTSPCASKEFDRYNKNLPRAERVGLMEWTITGAENTLTYKWKTLHELGWSGKGACV